MSIHYTIVFLIHKKSQLVSLYLKSMAIINLILIAASNGHGVDVILLKLWAKTTKKMFYTFTMRII